MNDYELKLCLFINRFSRQKIIWQFFSMINWLGNGIFWYILIIFISYNSYNLSTIFHLTILGIINVMFCWLIKLIVGRLRPYQINLHINNVTPLDKYSFPSGHVLHAVTFSIVMIEYYPQIAWIVIPFTGLVAISRIALGLHYPSDILGGAIIGFIVTTLF